MARIFTIDSIQGNSNLGNPVFSSYGKMANYQYLVLSPAKEDMVPQTEESTNPLTNQSMQFKINPHRSDSAADNAQGGNHEQRQQEIKKILKAYDDQAGKRKAIQKSQLGNYNRDQDKAANGKEGPGTKNNQQKSEKLGPKNMFKIQPTQENTSTFQRVPREYMQLQSERHTNSLPPVGGYRPRYDYVEPNIGANNIKYGPKKQWEGIGKKLNRRIKKEQWEQDAKLCINILKALDQEQVDLKNDRRLKQKMHTATKFELREYKARMKQTQQDQIDASNDATDSMNGEEFGFCRAKRDSQATDPTTNKSKSKSKNKGVEPFDQYNTASIMNLKKPLAHYYTQNQKNRQFQFQNQQIANSPYHLVKGYPEQQVIRQSDYDNFQHRPQKCIQKQTNFDLQQSRKNFVESMDARVPNDERFNLSEKYDRSTYLSTVRRVPMREFESYARRDIDRLLQQAGDTSNRDIIQTGARTEEMYDMSQKEKNLMERLNKNCLEFDKYDARSHNRSIYNIDNSCQVDPLYDSSKLQTGIKNTTKGTGKSCHIALDRQEKRSFKKLFKGTVGERQANIQRENDAADYIKELLKQAE